MNAATAGEQEAQRRRWALLVEHDGRRFSKSGLSMAASSGMQKASASTVMPAIIM